MIKRNALNNCSEKYLMILQREYRGAKQVMIGLNFTLIKKDFFFSSIKETLKSPSLRQGG